MLRRSSSRDFEDSEELEGLFSGYDPETHLYKGAKGHWGYAHPVRPRSRSKAPSRYGQHKANAGKRAACMATA